MPNHKNLFIYLVLKFHLISIGSFLANKTTTLQPHTPLPFLFKTNLVDTNETATHI